MHYDSLFHRFYLRTKVSLSQNTGVELIVFSCSRSFEACQDSFQDFESVLEFGKFGAKS